MTHFVYDGSFEGLLTAVFEVYERKASTARIIPAAQYQPDAFSEKIDVYNDEAKANRVWKGLQRKVSVGALTNVFSCYLSERPDREELILSFCRMVFATDKRVEENFGSPVVLQLSQVSRQLFREKHRFEAFVRFQQLQDGTFYASIDPDFNVIPLIISHFVHRYADQSWIIYDIRRRYGVYYNKIEVQEVQFDFLPAAKHGEASPAVHDPREDLYQLLWKEYFKSVNIPARRNLKLHRKHVPPRYWKYLIEKQPGLRER